MKEMICAFSSDARVLYKADIYKVVTMPTDYIIHFRYKRRYVDDEILTNFNDYIGSNVVIFFTIGNSQVSIANNISIRKAELLDCENVQDTDVFHVYLKLKDFCDITISTISTNTNQPPLKFLSILNCDVTNENQTWIKKVKDIQVHFPDLIFYYVKSLKDSCDRKVKLKTRSNKRGCYYRLIHGNRYYIELSIGNPHQNDCKLKFESSSDDISANIPNPIESTVMFDDIIIPIYLKSLNVYTESSFVSYSLIDSTDSISSEFTSNIEVEKRIGWFRPFLFGLLSVLAVSSVWILKDHSSSIADVFKWDLNVDWLVMLSIGCLLISTSLLYSFFNKK